MRERPRSDVSDGVTWWCPSCKTMQEEHYTLGLHMKINDCLSVQIDESLFRHKPKVHYACR